MEYSQKFFYEYVNLLVDQGCPKYDAIDRYIWDPNIPREYKKIACVQEELQHAIRLLKEEQLIRESNEESKTETNNIDNMNDIIH